MPAPPAQLNAPSYLIGVGPGDRTGVVKFFAFFELAQKFAFFKGLKTCCSQIPQCVIIYSIH
jgi:hypothetical protein